MLESTKDLSLNRLILSLVMRGRIFSKDNELRLILPSNVSSLIDAVRLASIIFPYLRLKVRLSKLPEIIANYIFLHSQDID